jgi:poly(hydroxyalkanoate) granule-associated protein
METNSEAGVSKDKKEIHSFYEMTRRMMLAGIGAIALKHDEIEEYIDKLVERGEIARKDRESLFSEMQERRKKYFQSEDTYLHKRMEELFDMFHVPAKKDVDELNAKISALEKKIDELTKTKK